jgi:hypothetical protein
MSVDGSRLLRASRAHRARAGSRRHKAPSQGAGEAIGRTFLYRDAPRNLRIRLEGREACRDEKRCLPIVVD